MDFENLDISPELREKAKACETPEELFALAKSEGLKLSEEELQVIAGGGRHIWEGTEKIECVQCGKKFSIDLDACPACGLKVYKGPALEY